ncbi:MAG: hypothetical protein ACJ8C4_03095 [Gemmataceae bacterium]
MEHELRSPDEIRRYLLHGLCLQQAAAPTPTAVRPILEWARELASEGHPVPPLGFVGDLGRIALGLDRAAARTTNTSQVLPASLVRSYEDYVLSKLYSDPLFERGADAVRRLSGRDRNRGVAYLVHRAQARVGFGGALFGPASIKSLLERPPGELLTEGWESLSQGGPDPLIIQLYEDLIAKVRYAAEFIGPEDVFELEHGTALGELGERVALRQVLQAATRFEALLPTVPPRPANEVREAPTRFFDEDAYPVGGFASISNRGSIESLLHSQLAFMETDPAADRPDLFDVRFLRDELLYYSRDENQFLRHRRGFVIALKSDLARARHKDPELPFQRTILTLGWLIAAIRKLHEWLDTDALQFEIMMPADGQLAEEERVLQIVLRDYVEMGTVVFSRLSDLKSLTRRIEELSRRSRANALLVGVSPEAITSEHRIDVLCISAAEPELIDAEIDTSSTDDDAMTRWSRVLARLLAKWL